MASIKIETDLTRVKLTITPLDSSHFALEGGSVSRFVNKNLIIAIRKFKTKGNKKTTLFVPDETAFVRLQAVQVVPHRSLVLGKRIDVPLVGHKWVTITKDSYVVREET